MDIKPAYISPNNPSQLREPRDGDTFINNPDLTVDTLSDLKGLDFESKHKRTETVSVLGNSSKRDGGEARYYLLKKSMATINDANGYAVGNGITMTVDAIPYDLYESDTIVFENGGEFVLTADASAGATSITGDLSVNSVVDGEQSNLKSDGFNVVIPTYTGYGGIGRWVKVAERSKTVDSIDGLINDVQTNGLQDGESIQVNGYYSRGDGGGGTFYWDSSEDKANHNGGTVINPDHNSTIGSANWYSATGDSTDTTGSGCWIRIYNNKLNVKWFGAKGDGINDDTEPIQSAIDSSQSGDVVKWGGGTYMVSIVKLPSNRKYVGSTNNDTEIKQIDSSNSEGVVVTTAWFNNTSTSGSALELENIRIDGNKDNNISSNGLILKNARCRIYNCRIYNCPSNGILITDTNRDDTQISTTCVENIINDCIVSDIGNNGIYIENNSSASKVTDGFIRDCVIINSNNDGIKIDRGAGWLIKGNHVWSNNSTTKNAINVNFCYSTRIIHNHIESYGYSDDGNTVSAIRATSGLARGSIISNNNINNNKTFGTNTYVSIFVQSASSTETNFVISNNELFLNGSEKGIDIQNSTGGSVNGSVIGNVVKNFGDFITIPSSNKNISISNNIPHSSFSVHKNGNNQLIGGSNSLELITWESSNFDRNDDFDLSNDKFIVSIAGRYQLSGVVIINSLSDQDSFRLVLRKNGSNFRHINGTTVSSSSSDNAVLTFSFLVECDKEDEFELYAAQLSGSGNSIDGSIDQTVFTGNLVN